MAVKLTADLIEAFQGTFLSARYDETKVTPDCHREWWALYCSDSESAAIAAPRGHAKSTALTHAFTLASALFRVESYIIIISTNEEIAMDFLGDITNEIEENEDLQEEFDIKGFVAKTKSDIIVEFNDGEQFRILARGSGQKMRGKKWRNRRPGLVVCDDLEDDEQVENKERRDKFRRWFQRAVQPAMRRGGKLRVHGTILHEDSLLARFMKDSTWNSKLYKAHAGFDDFSAILWPEQWPEDVLRRKRQTYIEQFDSSGYSQEYLNDPFDNTEAYLKKTYFNGMEEADYDAEGKTCIGVDFAISKADKANRTSMTCAKQTQDNRLLFCDQHVGRWDTTEIIDKLFELEALHSPFCFFVEDGVIWKAITPVLEQEMRRKNVFINCIPVSPVKDKATKGRSWQKRMKAGACRFDKNAEWYAPYEAECLRFTGYSESVLDDQFDSSAIVSRGFDTLPLLDEEDFMDEEELAHHNATPQGNSGRSTTTGY